jgi:WD40 repeat protein
LISFGADRVAAVWDPNTGSEVAVLKAFTSPNRAPTFDPTGRWLALQNLTRESLITLYDVKTWTETQSLPKDAFRPRGPVLFSLDGTKLIAGGSKVAQVWDLESRKVTATIGGRSLDDVKLALSPDGKVLYSLMSRIVEAFDIATSASLWTTKLNATQSYSIATHPTQPLLVVGDNEGAAILLNAATGKVLMQLRIGPTRGEVEQVEFSPDGKLLTAAMSNGAVVVMRTPALR